MTWEQAKLELSKQLGDPSGVKYGGILKNTFRSAYNQYVPTAPLEQLYLLQTEASVSFNSMRGSYSIPKSVLFINVSAESLNVASNHKRFIQVSEEDYSLSINNNIMQPTDKEVKWFRDNNRILFLSDCSILEFRFNYLPELDFDSLDANVSDEAIATVMDMVVDRLIPKAKNEYTNTNK